MSEGLRKFLEGILVSSLAEEIVVVKQEWEEIDGWAFFDKGNNKKEKKEKKVVVTPKRLVEGKIVEKTFELA